MGKILDWEAARQWRERELLKGKSVVFTNGVFDILHAGHLDTLEKARAFGDSLILGLNSDSSVHHLKGPLRPIVDEQNRAALLCGMRAVDIVVLFDDETPLRLLEKLQPDILVKGGDYSPETVVGREFIEANGGRVEIIPLVEGLSSTNVVETVLSRYCEKRKRLE